MIGFEFDCASTDDVARLVRALGKHRYVLGREHLIHAFVLRACADAAELSELAAQAEAVLQNPEVEHDSRDPRLHLRANDEQLAQVIAWLWQREAARARLAADLQAIGVRADGQSRLFDEQGEDEVYPRLIDAGWELLPLNALDPVQHAGAIRAINALGEERDFEVARFNESSQMPRESSLLELPLFGARELLFAWDGEEPMVVWGQGHRAYLEYLMRGVAKVSGVRWLGEELAE